MAFKTNIQSVTKFVFAGTLLLSAIPMAADDFPTMTFVMQNGENSSVSTKNLEIIIESGSLLIKQEGGSLTLPLAGISKFFFNDASGVGTIKDDSLSEVDVYNISGIHLGSYTSAQTARESLPAGIYIFKSNKSVSKEIIR